MPEPQPTPATVTVQGVDGGTRMTVTSRFASLEHLEEMVKMGMMEGMPQALGQIDDLLAAGV